MNSVPVLLRRTLDNLAASDFKRFRQELCDLGLAWGKLEEADVGDTVQLMVQAFRVELAGVTTVSLLRTMGQNQLAAELEKKLSAGGSPEAARPGGSGGRPTGAAPASVVNITASDGSVVHAHTISRCNIGGSVNFSTNNKK